MGCRCRRWLCWEMADYGTAMRMRMDERAWLGFDCGVRCVGEWLDICSESSGGFHPSGCIPSKGRRLSLDEVLKEEPESLKKAEGARLAERYYQM